MTPTAGATSAVVPSAKADAKSALHDCLEVVEDLRMEKLEHTEEVDNLRMENESLRESSAGFGALAERLSLSLREARTTEKDEG